MSWSLFLFIDDVLIPVLQLKNYLVCKSSLGLGRERRGEEQRGWKSVFFSLMLKFWFFLNRLIFQPQLVELTRGDKVSCNSLISWLSHLLREHGVNHSSSEPWTHMDLKIRSFCWVGFLEWIWLDQPSPCLLLLRAVFLLCLECTSLACIDMTRAKWPVLCKVPCSRFS